MKNVNWSLCFVADFDSARGKPLAPIIKECVEGGVTVVQLRAKNLTAKGFTSLGKEIKDILAPLGIPLIINDRLDIALAVEADGVHLGQEDLPPAAARSILGPDRIIGVSAWDYKEVLSAQKDGADYIGLGPVFPTSTKDTGLRPLGIQGIERVRKLVRLPILAIGGITLENAGEVVRAGADGIAVISALLDAPDFRGAARALLKAVQSAKSA